MQRRRRRNLNLEIHKLTQITTDPRAQTPDPTYSAFGFEQSLQPGATKQMNFKIVGHYPPHCYSRRIRFHERDNWYKRVWWNSNLQKTQRTRCFTAESTPQILLLNLNRNFYGAQMWWSSGFHRAFSIRLMAKDPALTTCPKPPFPKTAFGHIVRHVKTCQYCRIFRRFREIHPQ